ncbi:MAG: hypothetical protein Q8M96_19175 [Rubrivivax sp.]|nr:hypothetical protein [Rubrivivax sp.]
MNDQSPSNPAQGQPAAEAATDAANSILQRRRLLRAVGATGAIAGVGLPFSAHATSRPHCVKSTKKYHATASSVGSMIGSVTGTTPPVAGFRCSHYTSAGNWGTGWTNGKGRSVTYHSCANPGAADVDKMKFWVVFELGNPGAGTAKDRTCVDIINSYSTSDEAVWLTALFNANKRSPFTYTPSNVVDLYNNKNPMMGGMTQSGLSAKALMLFRDYLSDL